MAAMAISGWNRNLDPAGASVPFAGSAVQASSERRQRTPVSWNSRGNRTALTAVRGRLGQAEQQLRELTEWRSTFKASVPDAPVEPLGELLDDVPPCWDSIDAAFPFVLSIRDKCHRVEVGYPNHPSTWRSKCGWAFGFSDVARPVLSLPTCHKSICDRCCKRERAAAIAVAESKVGEVGVGSQ